MQSPMDRAYEDLANAIVAQAAQDYRNALNGQGYNYKSPEYVIKEIEKFFHTEYFEILKKVNGDYLIERLKREHLENQKLNEEGG